MQSELSESTKTCFTGSFRGLDSWKESKAILLVWTVLFTGQLDNKFSCKFPKSWMLLYSWFFSMNWLSCHKHHMRLHVHKRPTVSRDVFCFAHSKPFIHWLFSQTSLSFKQTNRRSGKSAADSHFTLCCTEHIVSTSAVTSQLANFPTPHNDECMGPNQPPSQQHNFNFTFPSAANRSQCPSFWTFMGMFFDSAMNFLLESQLSLHLAYFTGAVDSLVLFENV